MSIAAFKKTIRDHYKKHGRKMPWRTTRDPYRILVSEIMLQQTQVVRVMPFYKNFMTQFPNFNALARAKTSDVLRAWQGLGYNRRALALQRAAKEVVEMNKGRLPREMEKLTALPGIGPYTAGAIRAFAFNEPAIFIETNIRRVFIHFFFPRRENVTDIDLRRYIERTVDTENPREWYFALMDYGAMLGGSVRSWKSAKNPNRRSAHYARQSAFSGSDREVRGKILRELLTERKMPLISLSKKIDESQKRVSKITTMLIKDGFLSKKGNYIQLIH